MSKMSDQVSVLQFYKYSRELPLYINYIASKMFAKEIQNKI